MRILVVSNAESIHTHRFVMSFLQKGHQVTLLSTNIFLQRVVTYPPEVKIVEYASFVSWLFLLFFRKQLLSFNINTSPAYHPMNFLTLYRTVYLYLFANKAVSGLSYDSIFSTNLTMGGYIASTISKKVPKVCQTLGSELIDKPSAKFFLSSRNRRIAAVNGNDYILTGSEELYKERFVKMGIYREGKIHFRTGFGVDTDKFNMLTRSPQLRKELLGLNDTDIVAMCFRPVRKKLDFEGIIEKLPTVVQQYPNFYFVIGTGGANVDNLKTLAKSLHIEKHVIFMGKVDYDKLPMYLAQGDIFIDPINLEKYPETVNLGISGAFVEAIACGLIPVCSDRPEVKANLPERAHKFIYNRSESLPAYILNAIDYVADMDVRRELMGFASRKFGWHAYLEMISNRLTFRTK